MVMSFDKTSGTFPLARVEDHGTYYKGTPPEARDGANLTTIGPSSQQIRAQRSPSCVIEHVEATG